MNITSFLYNKAHDEGVEFKQSFLNTPSRGNQERLQTNITKQLRRTQNSGKTELKGMETGEN